jgi:hypothetical protein
MIGFSCEVSLRKDQGEDPKRKSLIAGILWTGEPQIDSLLSSIAALRDDFEVLVKIVAFKKNLPAHQEVWQFFNQHQDADYRIKLDGDMTIKDPGTLKLLLHQTAESGFYILKVKDGITGRKINGVNLFTKGYAIDARLCDETFPDRLKGTWIQLDYGGIWHCENATSLQIGEFVGHRLRKAMSPGSLRTKFSYLRTAFFATLANLDHIIRWGKTALQACLLKDYKTGVRSISPSSETGEHRKKLLQVIDQYGYKKNAKYEFL